MWLTRRNGLVVVIGVCLLGPVVGLGQAGDKPLAEQDIIDLVRMGIDADAIVARITKGGIGFEANDEALGRLKAANAPDAVLQAVQTAGQKSAAAPADAITYDQVLQLLGMGIGEDAILQRLSKSPTVFTLDAGQIAALKKAGASDKLLAAMAGQRAAPAQAGDISDFAIILDCSGSMRESTPEGESKMAAAKRVVTDLVNGIPDGLNLTFVIYGHEVYGGAGEQKNCEAVKVVRALSPLDASGKAELAGMIGGLQATGATPIALSLRTAGQELKKNNALCGMVLVTDGLETCNGDPAAEAAALVASLKISFGIHVVGFGVKPEENAALKSIADAGNGKYYAAADAKELAEKMSAISEELAAVAAPPEVVDVSRRALRILQPGIELPAMKEIFVVEAGEADGGVYTKTASITQYGEYLSIPSATKKYDVVFVPQNGRQVYVMRDFTLSERRVVDVRPESILGMIKVNGSGDVRSIFVMAAGDKPRGVYTPVSLVEKYDDVLVVVAGTYDLYVIADNKTSLLEEGLVVEAGKMVQLQN